MGMKNIITVGIDTNVFIYYFQQHPQFGHKAKNVFQSVTRGEIRAITSIITLIELLSLGGSDKDIEKLKTIYLQTPNLKTFDITQSISIEAARIRRNYGYRIPDSIQLATSLYAKASVFITNDKRLQSFKEIKIRLLKD